MVSCGMQSHASSTCAFSDVKRASLHQAKASHGDPKARVGIFIVYEEAYKAYRVFMILTGQVVISRDIKFDESTF